MTLYPDLLKKPIFIPSVNLIEHQMHQVHFYNLICLVSFRLSERNCIEIVNKLIAQKQLEVVHTLDGKEYITPAQISKEMRDELHVRGGK